MTGKSVDLNDLLALQTELMVALGIDPQSGKISAGGQPSQSELGAAIGITAEGAEILTAMDKANRKWKENGVPLYDDVKEELADVLFFVLELMVLLGLNGEEMAAIYLKKYKKNLVRLLRATFYKGEKPSDQLITLFDKHIGPNQAVMHLSALQTEEEV